MKFHPSRELSPRASLAAVTQGHIGNVPKPGSNVFSGMRGKLAACLAGAHKQTMSHLCNPCKPPMCVTTLCVTA